MKENKVLKPRRPAAKGIVPKRRVGRKPTRSVAVGDVVIPKKGVWAGEECLVLDIQKRPHASGYYQVVRVLLPNRRQRLYPLTEIKEIIPGKKAVGTKPRQQESPAKAASEKVTMKVVMKHISGSAAANLERAKQEMTRVLAFRGDVVNAKVQGSNIIVEIAINPKWDAQLQEKINYLKEWIPAKVNVVFKVLSVSARQDK
jgi:hypothetical protein